MTAEAAWVVFDAPLELLPWGRNVYTVMMLPAELVDAARERGTRRVEGTINGEPVNLGLNRADVVEGTFVYAGQAVLRRLGAGPGDMVACQLRPADPDAVPVPRDVADALEAAGRDADFERLRPAQRRQRLAPVENSASEATRAARIRRLVEGL